jgi:anti-anti-sigma factor
MTSSSWSSAFPSIGAGHLRDSGGLRRMSPLAQLNVESIAGLPVAHLFGEIDRSNAAELESLIADAVGSQPNGLVIDLSGLKFIDSTGIRMLFNLASSLKRQQQALRVVVPDQSHVAEILETVGLQQAAATDHTVDAAVVALTRTG